MHLERGPWSLVEAPLILSPMHIHQQTLQIDTQGRGLVDVTDRVRSAVRGSGIDTGLAVLFCRHTSAGLVIQENADPSVQRDLLGWLTRIAPDGDPRYEHTSEGPDDMAAHLRTVLTRTSESIPVRDADLMLGTWQGIYLAEHRTAPHRRTIEVHVQGVIDDG